MRARFFDSSEAERWDTFCVDSPAATFFHQRKFLSYHGTRFTDRSVVIEDDAGWAGVLPATVHPELGTKVVSHPGATFGGVVHCGRLRGRAMIEALRCCATLFAEAGHSVFEYRVTPYIYHRAPAQDDLYALHRLGARLSRMDLSCCIDLDHRLTRSSRRERGERKARRAGLEIQEGLEHIRDYWLLLEATLERRHGVRPTHTVEEMLVLGQSFPQVIDIAVARQSGRILAGVVMFRGGPTVHAQYIAANEVGTDLGA